MAGSVPVPGALDRGERATSGGQVGIVAEGAGEGGVEAYPLARESFVVDGLRGEGVAEHVAAVFGVGFEDVAVEQLPQRGVERLGRQRADVSQQSIVDPRPTHCCDAQHLGRLR